MSRKTVTDADIGALVREKRKAAEVSQPDLAEVLGVSEQMVQHYETGRNPLTVAKLYAIARKLRCAVTDLLP